MKRSSRMQNPIIAAAWADFVTWCQKEPKTIAAFNAETGRAYMKPKSSIETMIDKATGKEEEDTFAFIRWVTEKHWGMEYAPEAFREECESKDRGKEMAEPKLSWQVLDVFTDEIVLDSYFGYIITKQNGEYYFCVRCEPYMFTKAKTLEEAKVDFESNLRSFAKDIIEKIGNEA